MTGATDIGTRSPVRALAPLRNFLALDLDGVFVDWTRDCFAPAGERVLGRKLPHLREDSYDLRLQLGITSAEHDRIWHSEELLHRIRFAPVMNDKVRQLLEQPHCFITSRSTSPLERRNADAIRRATVEWVRRELGSPGDVHFVPPSEKAKLALELGATLAYEDKPETVEQLTAAGIRVRMPLYRYNRHLSSRPLVFAVHWNRRINPAA